MPRVLMYCTAVCPYCVRAEHLLHKKGVEHIEKIRVDHFPDQLRAMIQRTGRRTVPQIFIDERHIGGFDDLAELDREGGLEPLLRTD
jgi:glutaredoxin 3